MNRSFLNAGSRAHPGAAKSVLYGALEPAFATLHPEGSQARARAHTHTHTHTHTSIAQAQVRAMRQRQPDSLLGGREAGKVPETPTFCLSFDLHYERGGPEIFGVTGTGSGHHCVLFVGFNFSFVSLR